MTTARRRAGRSTPCSLALLLALAPLATGCAAAARSTLERIEMPLGSPGAVCVGSQSEIRARSETTVSRSLDAARGLCAQRIVWVGPLISAAALRQMFHAQAANPRGLDVVFEQLVLTDELGAPLTPLAFERLRFVVTIGARARASVERSAGMLPLKIDQRAVFQQQDLARIREAAQGGEPLMARVTLLLVQRDDQRRAQAKRCRGLRLALGIQAKIVNRPR